MLKPGKGNTTCLMNISGKGCVKASDHVPKEEKKSETPVPEPVIKAGPSPVEGTIKEKEMK